MGHDASLFQKRELHSPGHGRIRSWRVVLHNTRPPWPPGLTSRAPHLILTCCRKAGHQRPAGHGECAARLRGGEDGRHSQRRSALGAQDDCRAARGQTRALRHTSIRGHCARRKGARWICDTARTCVACFSRAIEAHSGLKVWAHSSRRDECARVVAPVTRVRARRREATQNSAIRVSRSEDSVIMCERPMCETSRTDARLFERGAECLWGNNKYDEK